MGAVKTKELPQSEFSETRGKVLELLTSGLRFTEWELDFLVSLSKRAKYTYGVKEKVEQIYRDKLPDRISMESDPEAEPETETVTENKGECTMNERILKHVEKYIQDRLMDGSQKKLRRTAWVEGYVAALSEIQDIIDMARTLQD